MYIYICLQCGRPGFDTWVRKILWRRKWQPTPVLLPEKFHGRRSLVGYNLWGCKGSDTTEWVHLHTHIYVDYIYIYTYACEYSKSCKRPPKSILFLLWRRRSAKVAETEGKGPRLLKMMRGPYGLRPISFKHKPQIETSKSSQRSRLVLEFPFTHRVLQDAYYRSYFLT